VAVEKADEQLAFLIADGDLNELHRFRVVKLGKCVENKVCEMREPESMLARVRKATIRPSDIGQRRARPPSTRQLRGVRTRPRTVSGKSRKCETAHSAMICD
jgi:hypothetical protein